jgi:hypothetical protein
LENELVKMSSRRKLEKSGFSNKIKNSKTGAAKVTFDHFLPNKKDLDLVFVNLLIMVRALFFIYLVFNSLEAIPGPK